MRKQKSEKDEQPKPQLPQPDDAYPDILGTLFDEDDFHDAILTNLVNAGLDKIMLAAFMNAFRKVLASTHLGTNYEGVISLLSDDYGLLREFKFSELLEEAFEYADVDELIEWRDTFTDALARINAEIADESKDTSEGDHAG